MNVMSIENLERAKADSDDLNLSKSGLIEEYTKKICYLHEGYEASKLKNDYTEKHSEATRISPSEIVNVVAPWFLQFSLIFKRNLLSNIRTPQSVIVKVVCTVFMSLFLDAAFNNIDET